MGEWTVKHTVFFSRASVESRHCTVVAGDGMADSVMDRMGSGSLRTFADEKMMLAAIINFLSTGKLP